MLLMIDNYDSFTYNVVQYLGELGADVHVVRNDEIAVSDIAALAKQPIEVAHKGIVHGECLRGPEIGGFRR